MEPSSHQPIAVGTALVGVSYASFQLVDYDGDDSILPDVNESSGLVALGSAMINIITGQFDGPVEVTVEVYAAPPLVALDGWDDVVEVRQHTDSGRVSVSVIVTGQTAPELPGIDTEPDSWFGLRVHARGRDIGGQYVTAPPEVVEHYLLQMWPVDGPSAEVIYRKSV